MSENYDLKSMNRIELEALGYRLVRGIENQQQALMMVNQELARRDASPQVGAVNNDEPEGDKPEGETEG